MSGSLANTGTGGRTERGRRPSNLRLREAVKQKEEGSLSGSPAEAILPGGHAIGDYLTGVEGLEILAEVAHDLRSPLTSILTLAETLQRGASGEVSELQKRPSDGHLHTGESHVPAEGPKRRRPVHVQRHRVPEDNHQATGRRRGTCRFLNNDMWARPVPRYRMGLDDVTERNP